MGDHRGSPLLLMDDQILKKIIEALLFTAHDPISPKQICEVIEETESAAVKDTIEKLREEYGKQERGIFIDEVAGGFQIRTIPEVSQWLKKYHQIGKYEKLSMPALETLAIIAYKQPIVRSEIEAIRGVGVDYVLKTLLEKKLIKVRGRKKAVGAPIIYGTGEEFLRYFGLGSLAELPDVKELEEKDEHERIQKEN